MALRHLFLWPLCVVSNHSAIIIYSDMSRRVLKTIFIHSALDCGFVMLANRGVAPVKPTVNRLNNNQEI
jgi:hypothetical protein